MLRLPIITQPDNQGNLETVAVGIRGSVEAQVERTGARTLPARRLLSIVRELPSSEIYFDADTKNFASIRSGSSYFKILGLPEEELPSLARFEEAKIFTIISSPWFRFAGWGSGAGVFWGLKELG